MVDHPPYYGVGLDWKHGTYENWRVGELPPLYVDNPVELWKTIVPTLKARNLNTVRLAFSHPDHAITHSPIDPQLEDVLNYLSMEGFNCILDLHNNPAFNNLARQDHAQFFGSWTWKTMWVELANKYGNDPRVTAFELFNEPFEYTWNPDTPVTNKWQCAWQFAKCYDMIREVCDKPIIFSDPRWFQPAENLLNPNLWIESAHYRPVEAIAFHRHPQSQAAANMHIERVDAWKNLMPLWLGETSVPVGQEGDISLALQVLQHALDNEIAFCLWFVGRGSLNRHWEVNTPLLEASTWQEPPPPVYTCAICGLEFATQGELDTHIQTEHPEPPPVYTCTICGVEFATQEALDTHIQTAHPTTQAGWCPLLAATEGTALVGGLPILRVFRDRCLPVRLTEQYYAVGKHIAPKIRKIRKK